MQFYKMRNLQYKMNKKRKNLDKLMNKQILINQRRRSLSLNQSKNQ